MQKKRPLIFQFFHVTVYSDLTTHMTLTQTAATKDCANGVAVSS